MEIGGTVPRIEEVQGRPDIVAAAIKYDPPVIPMPYKMRLNQYLQKK